MIPKNYIEFYGDQTRWFTGRVVDLEDPKQLGRIRVRVYGIHTEDTTMIADEDLPWAQVVVPVTQGGTGGFGNNLGIQINTLVFGMFLDGQNSQLPLVLGSLPKLENNELDEYDSVSTNPLARGIQVKPYIPDETINEPDDPFAAVYPNNLVYETPAGHVKEYDNTPNAERIRELHKSGTFYQVSPEGDLVTHIVRDRYTLVAQNDAVHIQGNVNLFIDGNCITKIKGNWDVDVEGHITIDGKTINLNNGTKGAARIDDTADTGDDPPGISGSDGSNKIETGSSTVFIGD